MTLATHLEKLDRHLARFREGGIPNLIGGKDAEGSGGTFQTHSPVDESLIATGLPFLGKDGHARAAAEMAEVMNVTAGIRRFGAASLDLAYVAAGRFDGFWEHSLQAWDIAAGIVLVREAGGMVTDLRGGADMLAQGTVLAANENLHPQLLKLFKTIKS